MNEPESEHAVREIIKGPPSGYFVIIPRRDDDQVVNLAALKSVIFGSWKLLLAMAFAGALIAAVVALQMPKIYRAQTLIAPVAQSNTGLAGTLNNELGGLAALAGVNLNRAASREEEAYATLASEGFAREFIVSQKLLPVLFFEQWDARANHWRAGEEPTLESAVKTFTKKVRFITQDRKTGLVTVAIEWRSPEVGAQWANRLVEMVNERLRGEATRNASSSIEYLNKELAKTSVVELRQAIYRLIENQVNNAMLANVQREFAFRTIDPAVPPELRISPRRTLIVIVGGAVGIFIGLLIVLLRRLLGAKP